MVTICGYELPTNLQNFTQRRLNRSEYIPKSFRVGGYFFETPCTVIICYFLIDTWRVNRCLTTTTTTTFITTTIHSSSSNSNKCVSKTDTNPPFAFQIAFPRGTVFAGFLQGGSKSSDLQSEISVRIESLIESADSRLQLQC